MRKVMEITHQRGNLDTDLKDVCALWRDAAEIVEAADEYYPACDPFGAQNARIAKLDIEAAFEGFDSTPCRGRRSASKRR